MQKNEVIELLHSKKVKNRSKAIKAILDSKEDYFNDELLLALNNELKSTKTLKIQVEMIICAGQLGVENSLKLIEPIIEKNIEFDLLTSAAAESYVRLKRKSINDSKPVIELLKRGGFSLINGSLNPLGYDKMIPPNHEIKELIELSWNMHELQQPGLMDPRYGIAAACAGWPKNLVTEFLNHCLSTGKNDAPLKYVTENALKGKYVKLR